jgi:hypothetical protein
MHAAPLTIGTAHAAPPPIMPVSQVRPGQKGYGLTVFYGYKVERFQVEVIDVMPNFLPKQSIILMRGDHPVLRRAGVLGGMSGSPIFINGKLVGALAYGWRFSRDPIFGVTPIENMIALTKLKTRGRSRAGGLIASRETNAQRHKMARLLRRLQKDADPWRQLALRSALRPTKSPQRSAPVLTRVSVPLSVSGVQPSAMLELKKSLRHFGLDPVQGGGTGGKPGGPRKFEMGGAIGVRLVTGDINMTGTGTVTWINGKKVLGFGHSMFNAGEIHLPVVSARINHSLGSFSRSFKLSSPQRELGALVQDRQAAIYALSGRRVPMIPMRVNVAVDGKKTRTYRVKIAKHRFLTAGLARSVLSNAVNEAVPDVVGTSFRLKMKVALKGLPALSLQDDAYSSGGMRLGGLFMLRSLRALRLLTNNPFRNIDIERIDVDLEARFAKRPLIIESVRLPRSVYRSGERVPVSVTFYDYGKKRITRTFTIALPKSLSGAMLELEVASGSRVSPSLPTPRNIKELLKLLPRRYRASSVVISLHEPSTGISTGGHVITDLPTSVLDALRSGAAVQSQSLVRTKRRFVFPTKQLITGRKRLRIRVKGEDE